MAKMKPKGKKVAGKNYVAAEEKFEGKDKTYRGSQADIKDVAERLKTAQSKKRSKMPRVKPQKKTMKPISGQKKINY